MFFDILCCLILCSITDEAKRQKQQAYNSIIMKTEIDYLSDGYLVAFKIAYIGEYDTNYYISPFVFENIEEAYYAAIAELSNRN